MKRILSAMIVISVFGCLILDSNTICRGKLRDPGLSREQIHRSWKEFDKIKDSASVQGNYPYLECFEKTAEKYDLPLPLLLAVARGESNFNRYAKSDAECYGIMQIQWPGTARDLGIKRKKDLYDACKNIDAGGNYLSQLLNRFSDDTFVAVAAYNYGPNRIHRELSRNNIPDGAQWYAAYIHRHLRYVLSEVYEETQRLLVFEYTDYKLALTFLNDFEKAAPGIPFEIFKSNKYTYDIYITYKSTRERDKYIKMLKEKTHITPIGVKQ